MIAIRRKRLCLYRNTTCDGENFRRARSLHHTCPDIVQGRASSILPGMTVRWTALLVSGSATWTLGCMSKRFQTRRSLVPAVAFPSTAQVTIRVPRFQKTSDNARSKAFSDLSVIASGHDLHLLNKPPALALHSHPCSQSPNRTGASNELRHVPARSRYRPGSTHQQPPRAHHPIH